MGLIDIFAQIKQRQNCETGQPSGSCLSVLPESAATENQVQNILAIVFGILAAVAILVIVIGAINYANTNGDPEKISKAKGTIIYALIGLVIAVSAEVLVLTFLGRLN